MCSMSMSWRATVVIATLAWIHIGFVKAIPVTYCSYTNTGVYSTPNVYGLQSLGHCRDECEGYAFAIAKQQDCWCSNYAPADTISTYSCDDPCPGYPYEYCGSTSGAFSYILIGTPSGTQGSSAAPSTSYMTSQQQDSQDTVYQTRTVVNTVTSNNVVILTTAVVKTQVSTLSTPQQSSTSTPFEPAGSSPNIHETQSGLSNGAVAGITIGVIAAAVIAGLLVYCCCWKPRRDSGSDSQSMTRNTSVLSRVGLLGHGSARGRRTLATAGANSTGSEGARVSSQAPRLDTDIPIVGSGPSSAAGSGPMLERRDSRPLFRDHRLNPNALMVHSDTSRTSLGTLQDDKDYSRPLEVRNPDPN